MKHLIYTLLSFLLTLSFSNAQPADVESADDSLDFLDDSEEALGSASNGAETEASDFLADKEREWAEKGQSDKYGGFSSASIGGSPSNKNFTKDRVAAYEVAFLNLKGEIAKEMAMQIKTDMSLAYSKPAEAARQKNQLQEINDKSPMEMGMLEKTKLIIHDELDNELNRRGINPGTPEAAKVVEAEMERRFNKRVATIAEAEMGAIYTMKTIEDGGNIAVVGVYSDKMKGLQKAILGQGEAPKIAPNSSRQPIREYVQGLSKKDLYGSHGVQIKADSNGDLNLLSYSQWPASSKSSMASKFAYKEAEMQCLSYLRTFAGEIVKQQAARNLSQTLKEFSDLENVTQQIDTSSTFKQTITSKSAILDFPGIKTLHRWQTVDKRSGAVICGVVQGWNISTAKKSIATKREFEEVGGSKGGAGLTGVPSSRKADSPATKKGYDPTKASSNPTVESLESEDF